MPAELNPSKRTVLEIAADLADGRTTSGELVEAALAQITDPAGEGAIIPVGGLIANAVAAALSSVGAEPNELPLSPPRVWRLANPS